MSSGRDSRRATRQVFRPPLHRWGHYHHGPYVNRPRPARRGRQILISTPGSITDPPPSSAASINSNLFAATTRDVQHSASPLPISPSSVTTESPVQEVDDDEPPAEISEVGMALDLKANGTIGCAYFHETTGTLYLQEETQTTSMQLIESLLLQAQPTTVIISSRAPEALVSYLDRRAQGQHREDAGDDQSFTIFTLLTAVPSDYDPDAGKKAMVQLMGMDPLKPGTSLFTPAVENGQMVGNIDGHHPTGASAIKYLNLGAHVNIGSHVTFGCVGALLRYFERNSSYSGVGTIRVRSLQTVTYSQCMFVTADTMFSLQLFHPGEKRNLSDNSRSVFDLFRSFALTAQGRIRLREIFVRPSIDLTVITERHDSVAALQGPRGKDAVPLFRTALRKIKSIQPILRHLRQGILLPAGRTSIKQSAWTNLREFCTGVMQLLHAAHSFSLVSCTIIDKALGQIAFEGISVVKDKLNETIDFQESKTTGHTVVAAGVDQELDNLKSAYDTLEVHLENVGRDYKSRLTHDMRQHIKGCIFRPQLGYLLITTRDPRNHTGSSYPENTTPPICYLWHEVLHEDGLFYFKTPELEEADDRYGDLTGRLVGAYWDDKLIKKVTLLWEKSSIADNFYTLELEVDVFHRLGSDILEHEESLLKASEAIGEIDSIMALSEAAEVLHLTRPQVTPENVLYIQKGRHILQERAHGLFSPNDCRLAGGSGTVETTIGSNSDLEVQAMLHDTPSTVVLTGPNHSGKSVFLKQVALIVYLAHIGSFVPAANATIGLTDKILTRIATQESVSRDDSAFGGDLRQAAFAINSATRRSLILLDEFGKGTSTADGVALLVALLSHFLCLGHEATPKVLAATHFHEIFEDNGFQEQPRLGLAHMGVAIDSEATQPDDKVRFLYKLQSGRSTESFGCHCAAMNGVDPAVVDRASRIAKSLTQGATLEKICSELSRSEIGRLQEVESQARQFLREMEGGNHVKSKWQAPRDLLRHVVSANLG